MRAFGALNSYMLGHGLMLSTGMGGELMAVWWKVGFVRALVSIGLLPPSFTVASVLCSGNTLSRLDIIHREKIIVNPMLTMFVCVSARKEK